MVCSTEVENRSPRPLLLENLQVSVKLPTVFHRKKNSYYIFGKFILFEWQGTHRTLQPESAPCYMANVIVNKLKLVYIFHNFINFYLKLNSLDDRM